MNAKTEKLASNAVIAGTLVLAIVCIALAVQSDARSDSSIAAPPMINTLGLDTRTRCTECKAHPPFDVGYALPKDMKPAERIDTF